jgi:AraC-like DNA-binding protein
MDFFAGTDVFAKRSPETGALFVGLAATNPIAHHYAAPLFKAGVAHMCLSEMVNHAREAQPDKHHWMYIVVEGQLAVTFGKRRARVLEPGTICIVPEGTLWGRKGLTETVRCMMFSLRTVPLWQPLQNRAARVREYEFADLMHSLVTRVLSAYNSDSVSEKYVGLALSGGIAELLKYELLVLGDLPSGREEEVESLFRSIQSKPSENWSLGRMTEEAGMPARTLTRHCRRVYGASPLELVIRQRLRLACELLSAPHELPLDEVAERVGYTSGAALSTVFYRHMGMRPGEYRRRQGGEVISGDVRLP